MSSQMHKIDWTSSDFFNLTDWHRIRSNLVSINNALADLNMNNVQLRELTKTRGYMSLPTVSSINDLEYNLEILYEVFNIPIKEYVPPKTWYARLSEMYSANPDSDDWNRWEIIIKRLQECIDYMTNYSYQRVLGTFKAGSSITTQKFSRGR